MTSTKSFILKVLASVMAVLALSGCAAEENTDILPVINSSEVTKSNEITPGGELRIPMNSSPQSMHPLFVKELQMRNIYSMIFEPLVALDEGSEPISSIAESWSLEKETNTWTLRLRSNVHWHGGLGDVSGSDCAFTINKILSSPSSIYYSVLSDFVDSAEGYDTTLIIHAKTSSYATVYALNIPVIPESYYADKAEGCMDVPLGSGCYKVDSFTYGESTSMVLSVFSSWWKKLPYIERITAVGYSSTEAMLNDLSSGLLDCVPTSLKTTQVYEILDGISFQNYLSHNYVFLAFNVSRTAMQNAKFRQAIAYAVNRTDIINNVYLSKASGAEQPIYNDSSLSSTSVTMYDHNATRAAQMLDELSYVDNDGDGFVESNGQPISLTLAVLSEPENPVRLEAAEAIKSDLEAVGISVTINALTLDSLKKTVAQRDYDMVLSGYYLSDTPDLKFAFTAGEGNLSEYFSDAVNSAFAAIDSASTIDELKSGMLLLQTVVSSDLPQIGLFFEMNTFLYRDRLNLGTIRRESSVYENINTWWLSN